MPDLGHDDFETREAATARLGFPLAALFLPAATGDPEVNHRLDLIRRRNLRWANPVYLERVLWRHDYPRWLEVYFYPGGHRIADDDVLTDVRRDWERRGELARRWGDVHPRELPSLSNMSVHQFRAYCDYHRGTAPAPREK